MLVLVLARQQHEPIRRRHRIVVEEGHDVGACETKTTVTRARQASHFDIRGGHDVRQVGAHPVEERRIVVDGHDRLERHVRLPAHALDGLEQLMPAGTRPRADDDGNGRRRGGLAGHRDVLRRRVDPRRSRGHDSSGSKE